MPEAWLNLTLVTCSFIFGRMFNKLSKVPLTSLNGKYKLTFFYLVKVVK